MRPTSAAISARAMSAGPSTSVFTLPRPGPRRMAVSAASRPATTHTVVDTRRTENPRQAGRLVVGRDRLDAHAGVRRPEQVGDGEAGERGEQQDHELAAVQDEAEHVDVDVERRRIALAARAGWDRVGTT